MPRPIPVYIALICILHVTAVHAQQAGTVDVPPVLKGVGPAKDDGVKKIGGSVSAPVVLVAPTPVFSEESKKILEPKKPYTGKVLVYLQVDPNGMPKHVRVLRGVGYGLDESAVDAVRQYRFKPAMEDGQPVTVAMNVEVNFKIE